MLTAFALLAANLAVGQSPPQAEVWVDWSKPPRPISKLIFGHALEAGDGKDIFGTAHTKEPVNGEGFWDPRLRRPTPEGIQAIKVVGATLFRFPGGCLGHGYKWQEYVGPLASRPEHPFGVMEFLRVCEEAGVEPLITCPDYAATPQDIGDLAEFLIARADAKHPWAKKRAAWGHPAPYTIRRWELGNETDHGNHDLQPKMRWTAGQYCDWALDCLRRIKRIDPKAIVGPHLGTSFPNVDDPWNAVVLRRTAKEADFYVIHPYGVNVFQPASSQKLDVAGLMRACMAQGEQSIAGVAAYRERIKRVTGRSVPLYATEYNALFVQEAPKPLRYSLGGAIFAADFMRAMMDPDSGVEAANYWQLMNGYFGMVVTQAPSRPRAQAALPIYRLMKEHFGALWLPTRVVAPTAEFPGVPGASTRPAWGKSANFEEHLLGPDLMPGATWSSSPGMESRADGTRRLVFAEQTGELHQLLATIPCKPGAAYRVSFEARCGATSPDDLRAAKLGLSVIDGRGWNPRHSGMAIEGVEAAGEWRSFSGLFEALPDCPSVLLVWRAIPVRPGLSGWMEVRNLKVVPVEVPHFAAYSVLTAAASLSESKSRLYLLLFNKQLDRPLEVAVHIGPATVSAHQWTVTGPGADAMNVASEEVRQTVSGLKLPVNEGIVKVTLPPCSVTSIEVFRMLRK